MNKVKITLLTAGVSLAMVFTIGCAGKKTVADIKGDEEVVSIRNELQELCNKEYIGMNLIQRTLNLNANVERILGNE